MHATEREEAILAALARTGFVSYRDLEASLDASPATIRRDLSRLEADGKLRRVHGGARLDTEGKDEASSLSLKGTPFDKSLLQNLSAKKAIGKAAAELCDRGEGIIVDGGSTTFQMCPYLEGKRLQVLTNSLHIVNALIPQEDIHIIVPSGEVFREQNIILAPGGEESMPRFFASKLFMGAASIGRQGIMQADAVLVASQRRFIERAEQVVLLVDSQKFETSSGAIVCGLDEIDVVVTDKAIREDAQAMLHDQGIKLLIAD